MASRLSRIGINASRPVVWTGSDPAKFGNRMILKPTPERDALLSPSTGATGVAANLGPEFYGPMRSSEYPDAVSARLAGRRFGEIRLFNGHNGLPEFENRVSENDSRGRMLIN
ncbi:hypothetical protein [Larkinella ripae]